jgi:hypothetical protein
VEKYMGKNNVNITTKTPLLFYKTTSYWVGKKRQG